MTRPGTLVSPVLILLLILAGAGLGCRCRPGDDNETDFSARVYGRVYDASTDKPLPGALVSAEGVRETALSDGMGFFALDLPGAGTYALRMTLDGYTYAQRRAEPAEEMSVVAVSDVYLTPVDPADISIGAEGGTGANSDGSIELDVPAGALGETTDMQATWYESGRDLPNDLPELSHFTYACELTPDGLSFEKPVTVRMENTRGFAPETPIPVGVYNAETLLWEHESMGKVSDDGRWVVFQVEHFSPRDCNLGRRSPDGSGGPGDAEDTTGGARTRRNNQNCGSVRAGSRVDVQDGHLLIDHVLPGYRSLGLQRALALQYNSPVDDTGIVLEIGYDISQTSVIVPERMRFIAEIGGNYVERYYEPVDGPMVFAYQWDGRDPTGARLPAGTYAYRLRLANEYQTTFATVSEFGGEAIGDTGVTADEYLAFESSFSGTVFLTGAPEDAEPTGMASGWDLVGLYRLQEDDSVVTIRGGEGSLFMFSPGGAGTYSPARGDSSALTSSAAGYVWTQTDGTVLSFDASGRLTAVADRSGNTTVYTYDGSGRLSAVTDPVGKSFSFNYGVTGWLTSITDPAGRATSFTVNAGGDLVSITNPDRSVRSFTYDGSHRMISQTDAGSNVTAYAYSARGAVERVDRPDGTYTLHTADYHGQPSFTDPAGNQYLFGVNSFGTRTAVTDPLGRTLTMQRDTSDRITGLILPGGKTTFYEYDGRDNLAEITWFGEAGFPGSVSMSYDPALSVLLKLEDELAGTWANTYDASGNLLTSKTADGRRYSFTYNSAGQRTSLTLDDRTVSYAYNTDGNLSAITDPEGGTWSFTYDGYGNASGGTDPDGRTWSAVHNKMNLLETLTNGAGETVTFAYAPARGSLDLDNRGPVSVVSSITDGRGNTTRFDHDSMYRLTGITDALGNTTRAAYDAAGRLSSVTRPTGAVTAFSYNAAGQLTRKTVQGGETIAYEYDNESGLPARLSTPACTLTYTYNRYNMLDEATTTFADTGFSASLNYDYRTANYAETRLRLSAGSQWMDFGYEWDSSGWLPSDRFGGGFYWLYLDYNGSGSRSRWAESYTGTTADFTYDGAQRQTGTRYAGETSGSFSWQYSSAGYCIAATDADGEHAYTYDAAGRLVQAVHPTPDNPAESYTYDAAGNRRVSGRESQYVYDAADRLTEDPLAAYSYDGAGNLTAKTVKSSGESFSYAYDSENRLTAVTLPDGSTVTYDYDPLGRRCRRTSGSRVTRYIYDRHDVLAEFSRSGSLERSYVTGPTVDMLDGVKIGGFLSYDNYYCFTDPVGSVLALTDSYANPAEAYRYSAFGLPVGLDGSPANTRLFAGADYDAETGLYYMRQRFYDPAAGRFLQREPLPALSAVAPYAYAGNNPLGARDPFGLEGGTTSPAGGFVTDRVVNPSINTAIGHGISSLPDVTADILPAPVDWIMPDVARVGGQAWSMYTTWNTVIGVYGAANPAQAGIDWYRKQWWNPARAYLDDFLTMGGLFERRQPNLGPVCGLREGLGLFFGR